jgi:hypothetical protein
MKQAFLQHTLSLEMTTFQQLLFLHSQLPVRPAACQASCLTHLPKTLHLCEWTQLPDKGDRKQLPVKAAMSVVNIEELFKASNRLEQLHATVDILDTAAVSTGD